MSDSELSIKLGADASQLVTQIETARAHIEKFQSSTRGAASAMVAAADAADKNLRQNLATLGGGAAAAKSQVVELEKALHGAGGGLLGLSTTQTAESVHVVKALIDEIVAGQNPLRALAMEGGRIGQIISMGIPPAITAYAGVAAAALAAAGAFGFVAYQASEAAQAVRSIQLDAAMNQFQLSTDQAAKLRDAIKELASVSASEAAKIARPFAEMGTVGATVAELLAPQLKQIAESMNTDVAKAAERVSKYFTDLEGAGTQFVNASRGMTQAEKERFAQLVATGQRTQAYAVILDLISRSLETLADKQKIATAKTIDQAAALQDAALAGGDMRAAQAHMGEAVAEATAKIGEQNQKLVALRAQLIAASTAAETFEAGMKAALKVDTVASGIKEAEREIARLEAGLAVAPDHVTAATVEMGRGLDMWREKLKQLRQQQADPAGLGRDLLQQDSDALKHFDDTFRGKDQARLTGHIAILRQMLGNEQLTAKERFKLQQDLEASEMQLYDQSVKEGTKAGRDLLGAARERITAEIQLAQDAAHQKLRQYDDDLARHRVSGAAYVAETKKALGDEEATIRAAYERELRLAGLTAAEKAKLIREEANALRRASDEMATAQRRAADESERAWDQFTASTNSAFTSQIGGLIRGTQSWQQAFSNVVLDLTERTAVFFAEWALKAAENAALQIAAQNTATSGIVASLGLQGAAAAAASKVSALAAIQTDVGQAFAGFAAFLAPIMGPAAIGAAGGLAAGVEGQAVALAAADIGMWNVPGDQLAMIHKNELIMPAAEAGAFRDMLSSASGGGAGGPNVAITPTTNFNISALDGASVARALRENSHDLMRAIDHAVRHGAHLGLRRIST